MFYGFYHSKVTITSAFGTYIFCFFQPAKQANHPDSQMTGAWTWIITPDSLKYLKCLNFLHLGLLGVEESLDLRKNLG